MNSNLNPYSTIRPFSLSLRNSVSRNSLIPASCSRIRASTSLHARRFMAIDATRRLNECSDVARSSSSQMPRCVRAALDGSGSTGSSQPLLSSSAKPDRASKACITASGSAGCVWSSPAIRLHCALSSSVVWHTFLCCFQWAVLCSTQQYHTNPHPSHLMPASLSQPELRAHLCCSTCACPLADDRSEGASPFNPTAASCSEGMGTSGSAATHSCR